MRFWRRTFKQLRRLTRTKKARRRLFLGGFALVVLVLGMMQEFTKTITPTQEAYVPLLDTIAKGESKGNYNAYFGNPGNTDIVFTRMTIKEVLDWQDAYVASGNVSNAVGKYQVIKPTLVELVDRLHIGHDEKFDENLQDRIAIALLERRGSLEYVNKKMSREQFAANIAMEWAALPKIIGTHPDQSYYAADGINAANVSVKEVYTALSALQKSADTRLSL